MNTVICEKKDRIAYVTLNRPDALNALDDDLNRELWQVWSDLDCLRCAALRPLGVEARPIAANDVHPRMSFQPVSQ